MSDEAKERTLKDIQQEYLNVCAQYGDVGFRILTLQKDLSLLVKKLEDLNLEAKALKDKDKAVADEKKQ